jgi:hypothetical protein
MQWIPVIFGKQTIMSFLRTCWNMNRKMLLNNIKLVCCMLRRVKKTKMRCFQIMNLLRWVNKLGRYFLNYKQQPNKHKQEFSDFLSFLGEIIALKGFDKFRGGLNVENNTTGINSLYATVDDFEIMYVCLFYLCLFMLFFLFWHYFMLFFLFWHFLPRFHVSTMLPFQPEDKQRVEKKRHIGNDIVVVVFKEGKHLTTNK